MENSNFRGTPYVSQYVGAPTEAFVQSASALQQNYEKNLAQMDQYDILAANLKTLSADAGVKNGVIQAAKQAQQELAATGDYEHAGARVNLLTKKFTANPELNAALENAKRDAALTEAFSKKGVGVHQQFKLQQARAAYKGIGTADENGNYTQFGAGLSPYEDVDIAKKTDDLLKDWKASKQVTESSNGKWLIKNGTESVDANELRKYATASLANDPSVVNQLIDETRYAHRDGSLSGDELGAALSKHVAGYVEPYAQKYGYASTSRDISVDPYGMNALTNAQENARQRAGFAHADASQARQFAHDDAKAAKDAPFQGTFNGNLFNAKSVMPGSAEAFGKEKELTGNTLNTLKGALAKAQTPGEKASLHQQIAATEQRQAMLNGIHEQYLQSVSGSPKERAVFKALLEASSSEKTPLVVGMGSVGMSGVTSYSTSSVVQKQQVIKKLAGQGIHLTNEQYDAYVAKKDKVDSGFSDYLHTKRENWSEQPMMDELGLSKEDNERFSSNMASMGNYRVFDETGENPSDNGRKFRIVGMSRGDVGHQGVVYAAELEPTDKEKKENPEAIGKRVTIVPGAGDTNYRELAKHRLKGNPRDAAAANLLADTFDADVAAVAQSPHDNVALPVARPHYNEKTGEVKQVQLGNIKRVPVSNGTGVHHFEYTPQGSSVPLKFDSESALKAALEEAYHQSTTN